MLRDLGQGEALGLRKLACHNQPTPETLNHDNIFGVVVARLVARLIFHDIARISKWPLQTRTREETPMALNEPHFPHLCGVIPIIEGVFSREVYECWYKRCRERA